MNQLRFYLSELYKQKVLLIAAGLLLVIITLGLFLLRASNQPSIQPDGLTLNEVVEKTSPLIKDVSPKHNSQNTSLFTTMRVNFSRAITPEEQGDIQITLTPQTKVTTTWQRTTSTSLILTPTTPLTTGTTYTVVLTLDGEVISQWSFSTVNATNVSTDDQAQLQTIGDREVGEYWAKVATDYPWYDELPLRTATYFVYFDLQTKSFEASLYPSPNTPQQVEALKTQVTTALRNAGIPMANIPINWKVR